jgi:hypothetical protein
MSYYIEFKPLVPPVFDASFLDVQRKKADPPIRELAKLAMNFLPWKQPLKRIYTPRSPLSLKLLARNVLLKHRPHKDWVEFCSYPKSFRDSLIDHHVIGVITPQLLVKEHPA